VEPRELEQIGPYRVTRYVDAGAFAWVFEVTDPKFAGRRLALKLLKPEAAQGDEFLRFERESQLLAGLDHPSLVTIFDYGHDPDTQCFYYTMSFVDGRTLKERLREGPLPVLEAGALFLQLLEGLAALHDQGIVHRDIKPANVLLGNDGRARLSDLGIARVETERSQTRTGVAVGTALYMSPEQARGRPVDARSDVFSVGLTLYEALTGHVVYDHVEDIDSTSGMDVLIYIGRLDQQRDAEFRVVFPREPKIPDPVKKVIRRACQLRAEQRFESAEAMREALQEALYAPARPETPAAAPVQHRAWMAAGMGGGLLATAAVLGLYFGVVVPGRQEAEARAALEQAVRLEERSAALAGSARALEPPPASGALERVLAERERAAVYLADAREDLERENFAAAAANLDRAREGFAGACATLAETVLAPRADEARGRIEDRTRALAERQAPAVVPEPWQALAAALPGLLPATRGAAAECAAADGALGRLAAAQEARGAAQAVEDALATAWPELVEESRQAAARARRGAEAPDVEAAAYRRALRDGKLLQLYGDQKRREEDWPGALDDYLGSRAAFERAGAILPAARARARTRELAAELAQSGPGLGGAVRIISRADELYAGEQWEGAAATYRQALEALGELSAASAPDGAARGTGEDTEGGAADAAAEESPAA